MTVIWVNGTTRYGVFRAADVIRLADGRFGWAAAGVALFCGKIYARRLSDRGKDLRRQYPPRSRSPLDTVLVTER